MEWNRARCFHAIDASSGNAAVRVETKASGLSLSKRHFSKIGHLLSFSRAYNNANDKHRSRSNAARGSIVRTYPCDFEKIQFSWLLSAQADDKLLYGNIKD